MAEMVGSAVVQETVNQIISGLVHKYEGKEKSNANENLERLEMAHIKLEAAVEISSKWLITDASLLRWRKKLKRVAQECDDTLHKCKQRILEEEQMEQEVRNSSFPKRIARATKSFVFSAFSRNNDKSSRPVIRRFEWFADGASEFLRFVELGGTPYNQIPINSFIKHLFAGKQLQHKIVRGNGYPLFQLSVVPFSTADHGMEASLVFIQADGNAPENNFFLTVMLQISESTDIVGITIKCLQLYTPHFKPAIEIIKKELTQLHAPDFSWVPYVDSWQKEHWDNLHSFSTQWFRPNPLCCKQHDQHKLYRSCKLDMSGLPDVSLEPVIEVNLQCQVSLSEYNEQRTTSLPECKNFLQDCPHLKVGLLFTPHGSSEDMSPANKSCAIAAVSAEEQNCLHTNITLEQLEEVMLPKAIDYFQQNAEATVYQMLWKSKHGTAYIHVEKGTRQKISRGPRKRKALQQRDQGVGNPTNVISHFLHLWDAQMPIQLRGSVMDWIKKESEVS